ncbi:hypothetical protein [Celeribacter marinus]|uniref:hypothetical protein n=1 Tax=Celeribacter marinus TaxID=1397108 RepID=UPI003F6D1D83
MDNHLYLMLIEADAGSNAHLVAGRRYIINCFAVAESVEGAKAPVNSFFSRYGWSNIEIQKIKQVPLRLSAFPTPELKAAARKAADKGVGYVVYDKPDTPPVVTTH